MRRREFILIAGGTALASTVSARAQHAGPLPVMGLLTLADLPDWALSAIREGLGEAGFVEGRNLGILMRSAEAHFDRLPALATDLVDNGVNLIFATGSPVPARTAKAATSTIPIVFAYGGDPVADGLVDSLNKPGANVTGATFIGSSLLAKRMEMLREIVPRATDVALLVNPKGTLAERQIKDATEAANTLGQRLHVLNASTLDDIDAAFASMSQSGIGAFVVSTDPFFGFVGGERLVMQAASHRIPGAYDSRFELLGRGLMSYGPKLRIHGDRQAFMPVVSCKAKSPRTCGDATNPLRDGDQSQDGQRAGADCSSTLLGLADDVIE